MKIKFIAQDRATELVVPPPVTAKSEMPKWYMKQPRFHGNNNLPVFEDGMVKNNSVRSCVPFYDSLSAGYIQKTWTDIHIKFDYDKNILTNFEYNHSMSPQIIDHREISSIETSEEFHSVEFMWKMPWLPIMPKGWSMLFTSPLNRLDLPFESLSSIIDSDVFYHSLGGNYPFYVKKSFNNRIIPAGTPMFQMIPFKRENWYSKTEKISDEERFVLSSKVPSVFIGAYKRFFHKKKIYK